MNRQHYKNLSRILLALPILYATETLADDASAKTNYVSPQKFTVHSNGSSYGGSNLASNGSANYRFELDAGVSGRVKSWKIWPSLGEYDSNRNTFKQLKELAHSKSYKLLKRPKKVNRVGGFVISKNTLEQEAVHRCNLMAIQMRSTGKTNTEIFSEDRKLKLFVKMNYQYDMSGVPSIGTNFIEGVPWTMGVNGIEVNCQGTRPDIQPATGLVSNPSTVTDIDIVLTEDASFDGSRCRVNISGVIHTSKPDTDVKYRYTYIPPGSNPQYRYSIPKTVTTDHTKTVMFHEWHNVPIVAGRERGQIRIETLTPSKRNSHLRYFDMDCTQELSLKTEHPIQRTVKFIPKTSRNYGNMSCPVTGNIAVVLKATGTPFNGFARLTVRDEKGQQFGGPNREINLGANSTTFFGMPFDPKWGPGLNSFESNTTGQVDERKQTLKYRLALAKEITGSAVIPPEKELVIECTPLAMSVTSQTLPLANTQAQTATQQAPQAQTAVAARAVPKLPDLTIKKIVQEGKRKMKVQVTNIGTAKAKPSSLRMSGGAGNIVTKKTKWIAPGKSEWIVLKLPKTAKKANFKIDSQNQVKESNEKNNKKSKSFK